MKLLSKLFVSLMLISIGISSPQGVKADESTIGVDKANKEVEFSSLSSTEKSYLESKGFSEEEEYQQTTIIETPFKAGVMSINAINLTASTKKVNATKGYTIYVITASKAGFLELNTQLTYGTKRKTSSVIPHKAPKAYGGGIYFDYTGKKKYFACSVSTQYYTRMGIGTISAKAGGETLGR
ncbi:TPA: hypothetical protein PNM72_000224 [Listeria monocytogenes]|uniref:Uncharacterized protein n=6 Tax=Listeria monocytogenes TaxID=1639 RepID=A0A3A7RIE3_LISMN|nr:hypothetical protein [Listeria monocytogenes]EAD5039893.1 hypothetical protein [Listeria monocytogenes serotype 1/2a]EAE6022882.1 hypothetical protein [Listeria monocytogenes serotype 3a]EAG6254830.1 hypothetical protein [Listeria monocytogenes CFSAN003807]EAG6283269.1 hypothetical protein [Listeria monocytogenes CFSAN003810]MCY49306.1 hypothetical protein [Listeria monocytogenes serotype 4b]